MAVSLASTRRSLVVGVDDEEVDGGAAQLGMVGALGGEGYDTAFGVHRVASPAEIGGQSGWGGIPCCRRRRR